MSVLLLTSGSQLGRPLPAPATCPLLPFYRLGAPPGVRTGRDAKALSVDETLPSAMGAMLPALKPELDGRQAGLFHKV